MLGKVSRVSHRSIHTRNQTQVNDSYLHWYKSHHNSVHGTFVGFHTEESDNEFVVEDERYANKCLSFLWDPYVSCYFNTQKVRKFRHYIQDIFEETFGSMRWIDLPGGQHQVAIERNYLMNYIWLIGFMTSELDTTNNKESGRQIRYRLEELIVQAEHLGIIVRRFFAPLQNLIQNHSYLEDMGDILLEKVPRPAVEKKIIRLAIKPDDTIFVGHKVEDFQKLLIYVRKDCQTWARFRLLPDPDKIEILNKGMMEITESLKELQIFLMRPLKALKHATSSLIKHLPCSPPTLTPYLQNMRKAIKQIMIKNNFLLEDDDKQILESLLSEISGHYQYILRYGEVLVEELWDIVLMARLSYIFISEGPQTNITAATYEAVLMSRFRKSKMDRCLKPSSFCADDFFRVDCPDTLRKLPVVVSSLNTEISLHLQGHRNTTSQASNQTHKFSAKRKTSVSRLQGDEDATEKKKEKLLFVSADDM